MKVLVTVAADAGAAKCADDARGYGVAEAEGVAYGNDEIADFDIASEFTDRADRSSPLGSTLMTAMSVAASEPTIFGVQRFFVVSSDI